MNKTIKKDEKSLSIPEAITPEVFAPELVIEQARIAAKALQSVIAGKPKKIIVNGEQYLEYEDWQTLARFYNFTVETGGSEEIWREGKLVGYKATATVYQHGQKAGGAEASCMRDERNWTEKPEFQLKSMAQTRAGAKALRNVLAWVAVLAGYKPTPAEEIVETNGHPVKEGKDASTQWLDGQEEALDKKKGNGQILASDITAAADGRLCEGCGARVNDAVKIYSRKRYGKTYCYACQKKNTKLGETTVRQDAIQASA